MENFSLVFIAGLICLPISVWGAFNHTEEQECRKIHNDYRETIGGSIDNWGNSMDPPCDMKEMLWSPCLAKLAQIHANMELPEHWNDEAELAKCAEIFGHRNKVGKKKEFDVGQNIWWSSGSKQCNQKCKYAVADWHTEVQYYDVNTGRLAGPIKKEGDPGKVITHLQQLVWANSSYVGCAAGGVGKCFIVCNYWPQVVHTVKKWKKNNKRKPYKSGLEECCPWKYQKMNDSLLCELTDDHRDQYAYDTVQ